MLLERHKCAILSLIADFSASLDLLCAGKVSTNDISSERLVWEFYNKIFTILVSLENSIRLKDSLSANLMARFTYETFVTFAYIYTDPAQREDRVKAFLNFEQSVSMDRTWSGKTFTQMLESVPKPERYTFHKQHYRTLSNLAHPTLNSFYLNRKGQDIEFAQILTTTCLTLTTIRQIIILTVEHKLYFEESKIPEVFQFIRTFEVRTLRERRAIAKSLAI